MPKSNMTKRKCFIAESQLFCSKIHDIFALTKRYEPFSPHRAFSQATLDAEAAPFLDDGGSEKPKQNFPAWLFDCMFAQLLKQHFETVGEMDGQHGRQA